MCAEVAGVTEVGDSSLELESLYLDTPFKEEIYTLPGETNVPIEDKISSIEELKMVLAQGGAKQATFDLAKKFFGNELVERAIQSSNFQKWPDQLSHTHVLILLGTIGHTLTIDDLEQCFAELKAGDTTREILKQSQIPYLRMWWAGTARQLPNYWLDHLLQLFRNPIQMLDPTYEKSLGDELFELGIHKTRTLAYTYYDYATKRLIEEGDRTRPEFYIAPREQLAKFVAYANPNTTKNGMIVPVFNASRGQVDYYQLKDQVHYCGLNGYFFTPLTAGLDLPAQLIFRGTDDQASAHRDLDPTGVGKRTFDARAGFIQGMLEAYAKTTPHAKVEILGHSLGAADAQRALINLIAANNFHYEEIKLFAYCSPKLDNPTITKWYENLKALETQEKPPRIQFTFAHHERDIVTWAGDANIAGTDDFFIQSNYLIVKSDSGIADVRLHHTSPFFLFGNFDFSVDKREFDLYQSFSEEELTACIQKLENLKNSYSWYLTIKSYFVNVDKVEDIEKRIEELKAERERLQALNQDCPYKSWFIWSAAQAITYTLQPLLYHAFGWLAGIQHDESAKA